MNKYVCVCIKNLSYFNRIKNGQWFLMLIIYQGLTFLEVPNKVK